MNSWLQLIVISIAMFSGSYLSGILPIQMNLAKSRLNLISVAGAGLLVGTAMQIILPEGVSLMYKSVAVVKNAEDVGATRLLIKRDEPSSDTMTSTLTATRQPGHQQPHQPDIEHVSTETEQNEEILEREEQPHPHPDELLQHASRKVFEARRIGPPLTFGFALMFIISHLTSHSHAHTQPTHIAVNELNSVTSTSQLHPHLGSGKFSVLIGMVVHAATDGIAMAASLSANTNLLVVFLAIMFHHGPSAFGLSTYMLNSGFLRPSIRQQLLIFSLSAPIACILTFIILETYTISSDMSMLEWTSWLLIFSAGTFLYVAVVDILPEVMSDEYTKRTSSGNIGSHQEFSSNVTKRLRVLAFLVGIVAPSILTIHH